MSTFTLTPGHPPTWLHPCFVILLHLYLVILASSSCYSCVIVLTCVNVSYLHPAFLSCHILVPVFMDHPVLVSPLTLSVYSTCALVNHLLHFFLWFPELQTEIPSFIHFPPFIFVSITVRTWYFLNILFSRCMAILSFNFVTNAIITHQDL